MNTNSKFVVLILVAVGWMFAAQNVRAEVVYNNSTTREDTEWFSQTSGYQFGDEVSLGNSAYGYRFITNFVLEYFLTGAVDTNNMIRLRFYANDGVAYGTNASGTIFYAPGTLLYDSTNRLWATNTGAHTLAYNGTDDFGSDKGVAVPTNFTWTVEFLNIGAGENAGLALYNPPTVGSSYADMWEKSGGAWALMNTNSSSPDPLNFGAFIEASVENTKPSVAIKTPADKYRLTNVSTVTVTGTATDTTGIMLVQFRVGHKIYGTNDWSPASGKTAWGITNCPLQPGTNYVQVYAVDGSGNQSLVMTRTISFVVPWDLTINTINQGYVFPGTKDYTTNKLCIPPVATATLPLEINRNYILTAVPTNNHIWSNWIVAADNVATTTSSNRILTFMMKSNMVLTADFETNRFIGLSGTYWGLFADNPVAQQSAGMFKIKVYSKQTFDGALYMQGGSLSISGGKLTLDGNGVCSVIKRDTKGKANMQVAIQLSFNSDVIQGTVTCFSNTVYAPEDGPFTAAMFGYKEGFNATNPTTAGTLAGLYNMALAIPTSPESPKGYGWLTLTVKTNGQAVPGSGKLGDNTAMAFKTATISKDGYWPFYVESAAYKENFTYYDLKGAYKTNKEPYGMAMGWMKFEGSGVTRTLVDNIPWGDPVQGGVHWIRKYAYGTNQFYPSGFTNWNLAAWGSPYVKPANTATDRALNLMSGSVEHADGDVDLGGFTNLFTQAVANKIVLTPPIASAEGITISTTKGQFSSSFYNTNVSVTKKTSASGVILQDENIARGVFSGSSASGSMLIK